MCLAQGHNTETPVRLEPTATRSGVKHSTTEPLRSVQIFCVLKRMVILRVHNIKLVDYLHVQMDKHVIHVTILYHQAPTLV